MLKAETKTEGNKAVICLEGRADTISSDCVFNEFENSRQSGYNEIEYDMQKVEYICSATLRAFLKAQKVCNKESINMYITGASEGVKDVFEITGFSSLINIV